MFRLRESTAMSATRPGVEAGPMFLRVSPSAALVVNAGVAAGGLAATAAEVPAIIARMMICPESDFRRGLRAMTWPPRCADLSLGGDWRVLCANASEVGKRRCHL